MPTQVIVYVDPDVSGGAGNGTSWANAYSSLNAAEAAKNADLTASDQCIEFHCGHNGASQTTPDTYASVDGWTTDSTRYISILTESADRHSGTWSTTKYRLADPNTGTLTALTVLESYTRLTGLQLSQTGTPASNGKHQLYVASATGLQVSHCLFRHHGNVTYPEGGIYFGGSSCVLYMWNCIVFNVIGTYGIRVDNYGGEVLNLYSCTVIGSATYGVRGASSTTINAKNCYSGGFGSDYSSGGTLNLTTCASADHTGTSSPDLHAIAVNTTNFTNVTAGSENFALPAGSALIGVGTTLTDDPPGSTALGVDIAGTTRS